MDGLEVIHEHELSYYLEPGVNNPRQLMAAFSCDGRPVTVREFMDFWNSLAVGEKIYYYSTKLS